MDAILSSAEKTRSDEKIKMTQVKIVIPEVTVQKKKMTTMGIIGRTIGVLLIAILASYSVFALFSLIGIPLAVVGFGLCAGIVKLMAGKQMVQCPVCDKDNQVHHSATSNTCGFCKSVYTIKWENASKE